MITVIGQFRLPAAAMDEARPLMRKLVEATRAEDGCTEYNYGEDVLDPGLIRVSEIWSSRAALDAHLATEHMRVWGEERVSLGLSGRAITVFDVSSATLL